MPENFVGVPELIERLGAKLTADLLKPAGANAAGVAIVSNVKPSHYKKFNSEDRRRAPRVRRRERKA